MGSAPPETRAKRNIRLALELAESQNKKKMLSYRLDYAKQGTALAKKRKITEAVKACQTYLHLVEEFKKVEEGQLMPTLFDFKKEMTELFIIHGIYWDLTKIYDQANSKETYSKFAHYLEKYIIFSKGMFYQRLAARTVESYLSQSRVSYRPELKRAYDNLKVSRCFIATALQHQLPSEVIPTLSRFRDEVLRPSPRGRTLIALYYRKSPELAKRIITLPRSLQWLCAQLLVALTHLINRLLPKN